MHRLQGRTYSNVNKIEQIYQELPPIPKNIHKLRWKLMEANGIHLIYNVPRTVFALTKEGPLTPYPGLCVAFLMYLPHENTKFCVQMGYGEKRYLVGWIKDNIWGMYSLTFFGYWRGPRGPRGATFPKGYVYVYFYFKNENTLNGWINDEYDLKDDSVHPYPVSDVGQKIYLGYVGYNEALVYEVHWVAWGSSHNKEKGPEPAAVERLFPRNTTGLVDFKIYDIFEMRTGTVVTIHTKYKKESESKNDGLVIGIGCATCTDQNFTTKVFGKYTKPDKLYTFRLTFSEKGALIDTEEDAFYVHMASYDSFNMKCRGYFILENASPVNIKVETMGQMWA